ncbi:MAG: hypothetical protein JNN07_29200 [Verrucomicrobiales bacterium]|nr:hypothetical protein [Verrucomicrobiales bacterium]
MDLIPNGNVYGCSTCHDSGGGGPRNLFGYAVEEVVIGSQPFWDVALALLDSDQDGFTNGEELGDPDGDGIVDPALPVSHPGDPLSFPVLPPILRWVERPGGSIFWQGDEISVQVEASDDQGVQFVLFEWSGSGGGATPQYTVTDRQPPYQATWTLPPGSWRLTVSALDVIGALSQLPPYEVVVKTPEPLQMMAPTRVSTSTDSWRVTWRGGKGPYQLQRVRRLSDGPLTWEPLVTTFGSDYVWKPDADRNFFRVLDLGQLSR